MATTKSTVLGIRLDHDRRAWVEAEAARQGVSVRGLFEGMIDGARSGETDADRAMAGLGSTTPGLDVGDHQTEETVGGATTEDASITAAIHSVHTPSSSSSGSLPGSSPWPDFGSITGLPGGLIRGAVSLTAGVIETSAHCAAKRLGSCVLTRRWSQRSV